MAKTEEDAFSEARAVVTSYDFGGYADLVVKAIMFEGPPIVGYLKAINPRRKYRCQNAPGIPKWRMLGKQTWVSPICRTMMTAMMNPRNWRRTQGRRLDSV